MSGGARGQRRGERVAPPPDGDDWDLRFATSDAVEGWEQLGAQAPGPTKQCWGQLRRDPERRDTRQHPLREDLATRSVGGEDLEQWQYEATGAGRVWYCIDRRRRRVWLMMVSTGHPKATE